MTGLVKLAHEQQYLVSTIAHIIVEIPCPRRTNRSDYYTIVPGERFDAHRRLHENQIDALEEGAVLKPTRS